MTKTVIAVILAAMLGLSAGCVAFWAASAGAGAGIIGAYIYQGYQHEKAKDEAKKAEQPKKK